MSGKFLLPAAAVDNAVEFQQLAAIGGAVGALVPGKWSIIGAILTPWSAINAMLAIGARNVWIEVDTKTDGYCGDRACQNRIGVELAGTQYDSINMVQQ